MGELDTITVSGFKSIASIDKLRLNAINVLIGPNGSGKSNFIGVFALLHAMREGRLQDYVLRAGGADKILHFGSKVTQAIEIHICFRGEVNQYRIVLQATDTDQLYPRSEIAYSWSDLALDPAAESQTLAPRGVEAGISDPHSSGPASFVRGHLDSWRLYHFHDTSSTSPMKKTADVHDNRFLRPDGSNLAAFLFQPEDVLVADRVDGATQFTRLQSANLATWLENYSLGQLWEKNELGGRPRVEEAHGQIADPRRGRDGGDLRPRDPRAAPPWLWIHHGQCALAGQCPHQGSARRHPRLGCCPQRHSGSSQRRSPLPDNHHGGLLRAAPDRRQGMAGTPTGREAPFRREGANGAACHPSVS